MNKSGKKLKETRHNKHLKKGDKVVVISGNDRGQTGTILSRTEDRALVGGINIRKKAMRKSETYPQGGVINVERPVHISNLRLMVNDRAVKLKVHQSENGKQLVYREGDQFESYRLVKNPSE